jgi:hypothetical protein
MNQLYNRDNTPQEKSAENQEELPLSTQSKPSKHFSQTEMGKVNHIVHKINSSSRSNSSSSLLGNYKATTIPVY